MMASVNFLALLVLATGIGAAPMKDEATVVTGRFVKVHPTTGEHTSLHKQDLEDLVKDERHHLRFHFDNELPPFSMHVSQGSVWDRDSVFEVQKGSQTFNVPHAMDASCYLRGRLVDPDGLVTFVRCGKMTGAIQTPSHHYRIEEHRMPEEEEEEEEDNRAFTTFKVIKKTLESDEMFDDVERDTMDRIQQVVLLDKMAADEHNTNNVTIRSKRATPKPTIELVAYLDSHYVNAWYDEYNGIDWTYLMDFIIDKWNLVQTGFTDVDLIGAEITIELKKIILWDTNPRRYPAIDVEMLPRLRWFCDNTPETNNFDQKVLYTKNTGGSALGMAFVGTTCSSRNKCNIVRSPGEEAYVELHELGHSLGLHHDDEVEGCVKPYGFMGWAGKLVFKRCYRPALRRNLRSFDFDCLFERNVRKNEVQEHKEQYWAK